MLSRVERALSGVLAWSRRVGRVTPCAPQAGTSIANGAHGVTRPTQLVAKFVGRGTRHRRNSPKRNLFLAYAFVISFRRIMKTFFWLYAFSRRRAFTALGLGFLCIHAAVRAADPFAEGVRPTPWQSPADQQKSFHLPPGFEIQLVAAEPDINKPMNLAFDARGRLWVTTSIEYPFAAPTNRPGRDRIMIFDDFGPDGRARKVTEFAGGLLQLPSERLVAARHWAVSPNISYADVAVKAASH